MVATSSTGTVTFYNRSSGTLDLAADLYGYWTGGSVSSTTDGAFKTVTPARAFDSRVTGKALNPSRSGSVAVAGHYGVPATNVRPSSPTSPRWPRSLRVTSGWPPRPPTRPPAP